MTSQIHRTAFRPAPALPPLDEKVVRAIKMAAANVCAFQRINATDFSLHVCDWSRPVSPGELLAPNTHLIGNRVHGQDIELYCRYGNTLTFVFSFAGLDFDLKQVANALSHEIIEPVRVGRNLILYNGSPMGTLSNLAMA